MSDQKQPKNDALGLPNTGVVREEKTAEVVPTAVVVRKIKWASTVQYGKYKAEDQHDSFGSGIQRLVLAKPDGKEIILQTAGKPVASVPTFQRQLIKLGVAALATFGSGKHGGYIDSLSLNLTDKEGTSFLSRLANEGWSLEYAYGLGKERVSLHVLPVKTFIAVLAGMAESRTATTTKYPTAEEITPTKVDEAIVENVEFVL